MVNVVDNLIYTITWLCVVANTGRISIPLAQHGLHVTSVDNSGSMSAQARRKAAGADVSVEWVHGDMQDFDLGKTFSLIILPNNALCHLLDLQSVGPT